MTLANAIKVAKIIETAEGGCGSRFQTHLLLLTTYAASVDVQAMLAQFEKENSDA